MAFVAVVIVIALVLGVSFLAFCWWAWVQVLIEGEHLD